MAVNLLLPEIKSRSIFAGIRTALACGSLLAQNTVGALRIISYGPKMLKKDISAIVNTIESDLARPGLNIEFLSGWKLNGEIFSAQDIWVATYWSTAHALDVACRSNLLDPSRVVYLVQDYEPGFFSGSTESAMARATYHAGFSLLVNSEPLRAYLESEEDIEIDPSYVFRPELDIDRLGLAAERRKKQSSTLIGFYGRPSKPRNAFKLGVAALRSAERSLRLAGTRATFISVGEYHRTIPIGDAQLPSCGKLEWSDYFQLLSRLDVMLSLQQSPHPSHPPLDAVASGGYAVTNEIRGTRRGLSKRLYAVPADPVLLGSAIVDATAAVAQSPRATFDHQFIASLGDSLETATTALLNKVLL